jgi:hypothetical protein
MDARAQLALMAKAKLVFESPNTFLSFTALSPVSYAPDQLRFLPAAHDMSVFAEFSRLSDEIPQGALFQPELTSTLSSVYLNVLNQAQLAQGTLSDEQTAQLEQALAFLQAQGADGPPAPSAAVLAYEQYQQAYLRAVQNYKVQQLTAENSSDPNTQTQWQNVDEPELRAEVDAAESDWETEGFKAQVEQARQVKEACVAQSPALQWQEWISQCNPDIDFLTDLANQQFAPSVFLPYDVVDQENWPTFTLTSAEIQQLANQAPPELANAVGTAAPNSMIDSVSFEFCSVALSRPWFHPEVFAARFWKFTDASTQLSDGNVPPQGQLPAYVTALIFARKIVVSVHAVGGAVQTQALTTFPRITLLNAVTVAGRPAVGTPVVQPATVVARPLGAAATRAPAALMMAARPTVAAPVLARPAPTSLAVDSAAMVRLNAAAFVALPAAAKPSSQPASPSGGTAAQPAPTPPPAPGAGQVSILAFVCKRLSKCPNPDPNLNWG